MKSYRRYKLAPVNELTREFLTTSGLDEYVDTPAKMDYLREIQDRASGKAPRRTVIRSGNSDRVTREMVDQLKSHFGS